MENKVSIPEKIGRIGSNHPEWIGRINDSLNLFALKAEGNFSEWHSHEDTDDIFLVLSGQVTIQLRDRDVVLGPGEIYVIPTGVEHCPKADEDSQVLLISGGPPPPPGWTPSA